MSETNEMTNPVDAVVMCKKENEMATDQNEAKLTEWADKIESAVDRQESKGGNYIVLYADECRELIDAMRNAAIALDGWVNDA